MKPIIRKYPDIPDRNINRQIKRSIDRLIRGLPFPFAIHKSGAVPNRNELRKACRIELLKYTKFLAITDVGARTRPLYRYDDKRGIWILDGEHFINHFVNSWFNVFADTATEPDRLDIINWVKSEFRLDRETFEDTDNHIAVQNGVLQLPSPSSSKSTKGQMQKQQGIDLLNSMPTLLDFNEHRHLTNALDVKYNEKADCPKFDKFLHEILDKQQEIDSVYEFIGRCLVQNIFSQNIFVFLGGGSNGKTTLCRVIKQFLGRENVTAETLSRLINNRFSCYQLYRKWLNIDPDVTSKETFRKTGVLKALVGGDELVAEKKFCDPFYFVYKGGVAVCANGLPTTEDDSNAFFRRWVYFDFPHQFTPEQGNERNQDELVDSLTTDKEMSGILNRAIKGLQNLIKNTHYTNDTLSIEDKRKKWKMNCDPVIAYCFLTLEYDSEWCIPKEALYANYIEWCKQSHYTILTDNVFGRELKQNMPNVKDARPRMNISIDNSTRIYTYNGIRSTTDKNLGFKIKHQILGSQGDKPILGEQIIENNLDIPDHLLENYIRSGQSGQNPIIRTGKAVISEEAKANYHPTEKHIQELETQAEHTENPKTKKAQKPQGTFEAPEDFQKRLKQAMSHRGRGRPKGSKNKPKAETGIFETEYVTEKKGRTITAYKKSNS